MKTIVSPRSVGMTCYQKIGVRRERWLQKRAERCCNARRQRRPRLIRVRTEVQLYMQCLLVQFTSC